MTNEEPAPLDDDGLDLNDPVRRAQFKGHLKLMKAAWAFLESAVRDGDLRAVWAAVDEQLRIELAQQWVSDNAQAMSAHGFDPQEVIAGLAQEAPSHELWVHFERVYVRSFRQLLPDPSVWGIGTNTRIVGPDLEALFLHDKSQLPPDGVWRPGAASGFIYPFIFRRSGNEWLLAMIGPNELTEDL